MKPIFITAWLRDQIAKGRKGQKLAVNGAVSESERSELTPVESQETRGETGGVIWEDTGTWTIAKRDSEANTRKESSPAHVNHMSSDIWNAFLTQAAGSDSDTLLFS